MNHYKFDSGLRTTLLVMIAIGIISMVVTFLGENGSARFWSNFLHNSVFFAGMGILALFFLSVKITAWSGWHTVFKRVWEAFSLFLIPGLVLMLVVAAGIWFGWHHLYHWADPATLIEGGESYDKLIAHKSGFLNKGWYTFGTLIIMGLWILIALRLRRLSLAEDQAGTVAFTHHHEMRVWAAAALPLVGFGSAALIWLWVMSVDAHWYSTLFAWYNGASMFVAMIALTVMILFFLKSKGYLRQVSMEHMHDLGKFLFAFTIFWTYLWFSQYMLIWYANVGEETTYFHQRIEQYPVLFYANLVVNFVLPFLILMRNDSKRKFGTMIFVAGLVFLGHWMDFFLMLKPGILHTVEMVGGHAAHHGAEAHAASTPGFTLPGFLEFGTLIGFLGFFLYFVFSRISKAPLIPRNDPYLAESIHHHT